MTDDKKPAIKDIEDMIQVVLLAIPRETSAREFYQHAAKKATSEKSRTLFTTLADQERGHEAELRKILLDLREQLQHLKG